MRAWALLLVLACAAPAAAQTKVAVYGVRAKPGLVDQPAAEALTAAIEHTIVATGLFDHRGVVVGNSLRIPGEETLRQVPFIGGIDGRCEHGRHLVARNVVGDVADDVRRAGAGKWHGYMRHD